MRLWLNESGYYIESEKSEDKFLYDIPGYVLSNASYLYLFRWFVFGQAMEAMKELSDTELTIYSDSRLIEELQGAISPENYFAKASLDYFMIYDSRRFKKIEYLKCAANTIQSKLNGQLSSVGTR